MIQFRDSAAAKAALSLAIAAALALGAAHPSPATANGGSEPVPTGPQSQREPTLPSSDRPMNDATGFELRLPDAATPERWQELSARADRTGMVPVIVALNVRAVAEGVLNGNERAAQRQLIANKRNAVLSTLRGKGHGNLKGFDEVPFVALHASRAALEALRHSPHVRSISEDRLVELPETTIQGTSANQALPKWWHLERANVYNARNNGYDGRGQTVAVLDTGVQADHPWLAGKVVRQACFATRALGSTAGDCPNGTWYQYGGNAGRPCTFNAGGCAHGTHVAGIAAGTKGVASRASLIAIQVFHQEGGVPRSYESDQLWGLKYVYDQRANFRIAAANLSIGGGGYTQPCDGVNGSSFYAWAQTLRSVKIATVVSSGNDNFINALSSPACNSNVVSVGNTTLTGAGKDAVFGNYWNGRAYTGSNSASFLKLLAPGTRICSSIPGSSSSCAYTGTSMAAPHVAGAIAVLKQLRPGAGVTASVTALRSSGTAVYDSRNGITKNRINVWKAVIYLYNN